MKTNVEFKEFKISDLFITQGSDSTLQVPTGASISKDKLKAGKTPRISVTSYNNGILGYYEDMDDKNYRVFKNSISISFLGTVFYHPYKASYDMKVHCLMLKDRPLTENIALYFLPLLKKLVENNTYGKQTTSKDIPNFYIKLPVTPTGEPDYEYMSELISELEQERISELEAYLTATGLDDYELTPEDIAVLQSELGGVQPKQSCVSSYPLSVEWKEFDIADIFEIQKVTNVLSKDMLKPTGVYPAYSSDTMNSGIQGYYDDPEFIIDDITPRYIIFGDHTKTMNIADKSFSVLDNVKVLKPKFYSDKAFLYVFSVWKKQIKNLGYARHWKIAKDCKLMLPADQGILNIKFMEDYITAIEKTVIKGVVEYKDTIIAKTKNCINN